MRAESSDDYYGPEEEQGCLGCDGVGEHLCAECHVQTLEETVAALCAALDAGNHDEAVRVARRWLGRPAS